MTISILESGKLMLPYGEEFSKESDSIEIPKIEIKPRINPFELHKK